MANKNGTSLPPGNLTYGGEIIKEEINTSTSRASEDSPPMKPEVDRGTETVTMSEGQSQRQSANSIALAYKSKIKPPTVWQVGT